MFQEGEKVITEVGVSFRFLRPDESWNKFYPTFTYKWAHNPSGKWGYQRIVIYGTEKDYLKLLHWWNRTDEWMYSPIS